MASAGKSWNLKKAFSGLPTRENFELTELLIPHNISDGEVVCEAVYISVDPYVRIFCRPIPTSIGEPVNGYQVARVIQSKNENFPVGTYVTGDLGWSTHSLVSDQTKIQHLPDVGSLPLSHTLGVMGMTGVTAHLAFLENCQPKPDDVVVINAAAGAIGSTVGQIAKIKGCKVIGFAGTAEKCNKLIELGFDEVFNYKTTSVSKSLDTAAPDGVDCFFDNVGGTMASAVIQKMRGGGRMCACGNISNYNRDPSDPELVPSPFGSILRNQLTIRSFLIFEHLHRYREIQTELLHWIQQGKLKPLETVTEGFDHIPDVFIGLFSGNNLGKAVVKI